MNRKFQVFVSSTFKDLVEERQSAVGAILTAGHIPAGMELFKPGDQTQLDIIKRWIDESDIYLLILGGRYGTIAPNSEYSYTELEYDYALKSNKPLFSIVIDSEYLKGKVKEFGADVLELNNPSKYSDFRNKVVSYPVEFFNDNKDIQIAIYKTLPTLISERDLKGWVSGKDVPDSTVLIEQINRLTRENESLSSQVALFSGQSLDTSESILTKSDVSVKNDFSKTIAIFEGSKLTMSADVTNSGESVKTNVMRLLVVYRGTILSGLATTPQSGIKAFLVRNVCTAMQVHGLMQARPIMDGRFLHFDLTEKGAEFYKYVDEMNLNN